MASSLSPLQYVTYRAAHRELQGSLCVILLVLHCTVALLADRSASIFAFLQIIADSCSLSPPCLPGGFISIFSGKYHHWIYLVRWCQLLAALGVVPASRVAMDTSSLLVAFDPPTNPLRHLLPSSSLAMSLNIC